MARASDALERGLALIRGNIGGILVEAIINFALPYMIYGYFEHRQGEVMALIYSSGPPIAWTLIVLAWKREVDFISAFVVAGIVLSLLAMLGGGSVKFLQLREKLVTVIIGLAFLISALIKRPLIYELARAGMKRNKSAELGRLEALKDDPRMRHSMTVMTLVWGIGLLLDAAISAGLVMVLTVKQYLIVGPIFGYSVTGGLTLWMFLYIRYRRRLGDARRAQEAAQAAALPAGERA
jgi:diacylglycerol kinase